LKIKSQDDGFLNHLAVKTLTDINLCVTAEAPGAQAKFMIHKVGCRYYGLAVVCLPFRQVYG